MIRKLIRWLAKREIDSLRMELGTARFDLDYWFDEWERAIREKWDVSIKGKSDICKAIAEIDKCEKCFLCRGHRPNKEKE